ncbi:HEAT repeat domain-containing protein, partial [Flavilitoribacter nigricans]
MHKLFLSLLFFLLLQNSYGQELYLFGYFEQDSTRSDRQLEGLMSALRDSSVSVKQAALERLADTPWAGHIPPQYHAIISSQIDSTYRYLSIAAIKILTQQQLLNDSIDNHIAAPRKDDVSYVRRPAAQVLRVREAALSEVYLQHTNALFKDYVSDVHRSAAQALIGQEALPEVYLQQIVALLKDKDSFIRRHAAQALRVREALPEVYLQQIAALLKDDVSEVRRSAAQALSGQEALPEVYLQQIAALLKDDVS